MLGYTLYVYEIPDFVTRNIFDRPDLVELAFKTHHSSENFLEKRLQQFCRCNRNVSVVAIQVGLAYLGSA